MPTDSLSAAEILKSLGISAEMIHLDSGHGYESVIADLRAWWPLLVAGGILIGDDYTPRGGGGWVSVQRAFDDFFGALDLNSHREHWGEMPGAQAWMIWCTQPETTHVSQERSAGLREFIGNVKL
jgi:hypothetical protein